MRIFVLSALLLAACGTAVRIDGTVNGTRGPTATVSARMRQIPDGRWIGFFIAHDKAATACELEATFGSRESGVIAGTALTIRILNMADDAGRFELAPQGAIGQPFVDAFFAKNSGTACEVFPALSGFISFEKSGLKRTKGRFELDFGEFGTARGTFDLDLGCAWQPDQFPLANSCK